MKEVASLRYGVIFKKAFSVPEIFTAFVRDFLGIEIEIDRAETEKSFDPPVGRVACRFDLYAEDKKNRVIVDIQHERLFDHYDRFLHYHCAAILEQAADSKSYSPDLKVFTLVVLTSGDRHKRDIAIIDFDPRDLEDEKLGEIKHKIMYICPKYVTDKTPEAYREWMLAIADSLDEVVEESEYSRPEIHKIFQYIEKDRISPYERAKMFDEYAQEKLKQETRNAGIEEGKKIGKEETALAMLSLGKLSEEEIARVTGLSPEKIRSLSLK
jgi:predicted transposase/invertase (TIGR01784 family)